MAVKVDVSGLTFSYPRGSTVLDDVCLSLKTGEVCTILGPNGAGKTTLLNCLGGYLAAQSGTVLLDGVDVSIMDAGMRAKKLGFVAQLASDAIDMEVLDYMVLGGAMRIGLFSMPSEDEYRKADHIVDALGITHLKGKPVADLSGGERQQVEIAKVLLQDTDIVLMDEPTNHLDYGNQVKVLKTIRLLSHDAGKTVVLTTHMPDHAILLGGITAILDDRGHLESGPAEEMVAEERLRSIYRTDVRLVWVEELGRMACLTESL